MGKLIGQREDERDERVLVSGIDLEDVEADAFRFARLVQEPVRSAFASAAGIASVDRGLSVNMDRPQDRNTRSSRVIGS